MAHEKHDMVAQGKVRGVKYMVRLENHRMPPITAYNDLTAGIQCYCR